MCVETIHSVKNAFHLSSSLSPASLPPALPHLVALQCLKYPLSVAEKLDSVRVRGGVVRGGGGGGAGCSAGGLL